MNEIVHWYYLYMLFIILHRVVEKLYVLSYLSATFSLTCLASFIVLRYYSKELISVPTLILEIQQSLVKFDPAFSFGLSSSLLRLILYVKNVWIKYYCVVEEKTMPLWWMHLLLVPCINFHSFTLVIWNQRGCLHLCQSKIKDSSHRREYFHCFSLFPVVTLSINYLFVMLPLFLSNKSISFWRQVVLKTWI